MKEVLTRKFWRDVKKTFEEARAEAPPPGASAPIEANAGPTETPAAPETTAPVTNSATVAGTEPNP